MRGGGPQRMQCRGQRGQRSWQAVSMTAHGQRHTVSQQSLWSAQSDWSREGGGRKREVTAVNVPRCSGRRRASRAGGNSCTRMYTQRPAMSASYTSARRSIGRTSSSWNAATKAPTTRTNGVATANAAAVASVGGGRCAVADAAGSRGASRSESTARRNMAWERTRSGGRRAAWCQGRRQ